MSVCITSYNSLTLLNLFHCVNERPQMSKCGYKQTPSRTKKYAKFFQVARKRSIFFPHDYPNRIFLIYIHSTKSHHHYHYHYHHPQRDDCSKEEN